MRTPFEHPLTVFVLRAFAPDEAFDAFTISARLGSATCPEGRRAYGAVGEDILSNLHHRGLTAPDSHGWHRMTAAGVALRG